MKRFVRADPGKKILYMKFSGFHRVDDARLNVAAIREEVRRLEPGFSIINDISDFEVGSPEAFELMKEGMAFLRSVGCHRVIRVVGKAVAEMQFAMASEEIGYEADVASTVEEAERLLESETV